MQSLNVKAFCCKRSRHHPEYLLKNKTKQKNKWMSLGFKSHPCGTPGGCRHHARIQPPRVICTLVCAQHSHPCGAAVSNEPGAITPGAELGRDKLTAHFLRCAWASGKFCHVTYMSHFPFSSFSFSWAVSQYEVCRAEKYWKKKIHLLCKVIWTPKNVWI